MARSYCPADLAFKNRAMKNSADIRRLWRTVLFPATGWFGLNASGQPRTEVSPDRSLFKMFLTLHPQHSAIKCRSN